MYTVIFSIGVIITTMVLVGIFYEVKGDVEIPHDIHEDTRHIDYDGMGNYSRYPKIKRK